MTTKNSAYYVGLLRKLRDDAYPREELPSKLDEIENWLLEQDQRQKVVVDQPDLLTDNLFRQIVDDASVGVGVFSASELLYANSHLLRLFGYNERDRNEITYSDICCRYATDRTRTMLKERETLMANGMEDLDPCVGEFTFPDGRKMFLEIHSDPFHTAHGTWRICLMYDLTDKIETQVHLDQEMHRFQSIINGTGAGTWEWNLRERKGNYNEKWGEIFGYTPADFESVKGNQWLSLVHPADAENVDSLTADVIAGKTIILQFEARLRHKNGHWVWVLCRGGVTDWDSNGNPLILSGAGIDITDKKVAEEKLVLAKEELEKSVKALSFASQAKEDFLSTMSHEIRTPLNAVIGLTNLLLRRNPRADQLEIVKVLKNSSDNLLHLVNDILDYNKIQAGKLQLESVQFNFREFLGHLYSTFKIDAHDRGIDLQVKADLQIPDILEGDVTRLNQILINLLSNALKFTKKGKVSLDASLISKEDGMCMVKFVISDTGIGIHPSKLDKIFEPFHQSEASITRQFGGTGLGLSIIKALVKMFEGSIEVTSLPGMGSSFSVLLKLREQSSIPVDPWVTGWELPFNSARTKILYVEDVESNRFVVRNLMEEFNLKCTLASSGKEALELTRETTFDIILMDIQMPEMDGYQAAEKIAGQVNGKNLLTPIIAFTAEPISEKLKTKLKKHNMRDVISKPFDIKQLLEKISQIVVDVGRNPEYSLAFYDRPHSEHMSEDIRTLVADEIDSFTTALFEAFHENNMAKMRGEIHKLHPIIKSLKMVTVSALLDQLREYEKISPLMLEILAAIKGKIDPVVMELKTGNQAPSAQ